MTPAVIYSFALLSGLLPAVIWLLFWLREDRKRPEPVRRILIVFIAGMLAAGAAIPLQYLAKYFLAPSVEEFSSHLRFITEYTTTVTLLFLAWAVIEEVLKAAAAYFSGLKSPAYDEPIDAPIYFITAALGFVALENSLFILQDFVLSDGGLLLTQETLYQGSLTSGTRFLGASLLHILASATIGITVALTYYERRIKRIFWIGLGLCIAIILHLGFNLLIMRSIGSNNGAGIFVSYLLVWAAILIIFLLFERIKALTREHYDTT